MFDLIIIGGGAAGIFSAALMGNASKVLVLEKSSKLLSKVAISGGGRCNVTHACFDPAELTENYPRGMVELLGPFHHFGPGDMIAWLDEKGVELKVESDGRMFPVSDKSLDIVNALLNSAKENNVEIRTGISVESIYQKDDNWIVNTGEQQLTSRYVLIASGGGPKMSQFSFLKDLSLEIKPPVPSLFTFNLIKKDITRLMGVSVAKAFVSINGFEMETEGPLLITHWGFSGPAVLKLSAFAARYLAEKDYKFQVKINWTGSEEDNLKEWFRERRSMHPTRPVHKTPLFGIVSRLWEFLCDKAGVFPFTIWAELRKEQEQKLIGILLSDIYECQGKTTFKEEFVTCGGVELSEIDFRTMESRKNKGLFFAGEVLDIDAVTGGFNFQAAWTTSYIATREIKKRLT